MKYIHLKQILQFSLEYHLLVATTLVLPWKGITDEECVISGIRYKELSNINLKFMASEKFCIAPIRCSHVN